MLIQSEHQNYKYTFHRAAATIYIHLSIFFFTAPDLITFAGSLKPLLSLGKGSHWTGRQTIVGHTPYRQMNIHANRHIESKGGKAVRGSEPQFLPWYCKAPDHTYGRTSSTAILSPHSQSLFCIFWRTPLLYLASYHVQFSKQVDHTF